MTDFARSRAAFHLPEGLVYLDGNSLGPLPVAAIARAERLMRAEWGELLIGAWNKAGWMEMPGRLGDRIGRLIGAPRGSVMVGDTLSVKVYQALASCLEMRPDRRVLLTDTGNFPSDLYMADGLVRSLGRGHVVRRVEPDEVAAAIDDTVAVVFLTEADYRTGRLHDMGAITARAHAAGALTCWDLAHTAGALPVDLAGCDVDFAAGCTYKYLNGGPGAPAFIYVRPGLQGETRPALSGWLGHEAPFAFDADYRPAGGIERMRVGTPPVIQLAVLDAALDVWDAVDMADVRARSVELSQLFIAEVERRCRGMEPRPELASPRDPARRGSQVSFRFAEAYGAMQALIARGVTGDFRAPDIMRFGITPLYLDEDDIRSAAARIGEVMASGAWRRPEYRLRAAVT